MARVNVYKTTGEKVIGNGGEDVWVDRVGGAFSICEKTGAENLWEFTNCTTPIGDVSITSTQLSVKDQGGHTDTVPIPNSVVAVGLYNSSTVKTDKFITEEGATTLKLITKHKL